MKRKLTLGLMVFFVGVLITACGSKNSGSPAAAPAEDKNTPTTFDDKVCTNSNNICPINGSFIIADEALYLQAFGYQANTSNIFGNSFTQNVLGELAVAVIDPDIDPIQCGKDIFTTLALAELFYAITGNNIDIEAECITTSSISFNNTAGDTSGNTLNQTNSAVLEVAYNGNQATHLQLTIQNQAMNQSDVKVFARNSSDVYVNSADNGLTIINRSGRIELIKDGRLVGVFQ